MLVLEAIGPSVYNILGMEESLQIDRFTLCSLDLRSSMFTVY